MAEREQPSGDAWLAELRDYLGAYPQPGKLTRRQLQIMNTRLVAISHNLLVMIAQAHRDQDALAEALYELATTDVPADRRELVAAACRDAAHLARQEVTRCKVCPHLPARCAGCAEWLAKATAYARAADHLERAALTTAPH